MYPTIQLEYRGTKLEDYSFIDKQTGAKREGFTITHSFEGPNGELFALRELANGVAKDAYKPSLKKGTMCVVSLKQFESDKGVGRGVIAQVNPLPAK